MFSYLFHGHEVVQNLKLCTEEPDEAKFPA